MQVYVTTLIADEGTIVVFEGYDEWDNTLLFTVDHRLAQAIVDTLDIGGCYADIESWQILGRSQAGLPS